MPSRPLSARGSSQRGGGAGASQAAAGGGESQSGGASASQLAGGSQGGGSDGCSSGGGRRDLVHKGVVIALSGFVEERTAVLKRLVQTTLKGRLEESSDVSGCTHMVVVRPLKRTAKLCAALSLPAVRLVTDDWLKACESAKAFVDCRPFELRGEHASKPGAASPWAFNVDESRARAAAAKCLAGHAFYVTPCKQPKTRFGDADLKMIVRCAGGTVLDATPASGQAAIVLSTEEERPSWAKLAKANKKLTVVKAEQLLTAVLRQEPLDLAAGKLE